MGAFNASVNSGHGVMTPRGARGSLVSARNGLEIMGTLFSIFIRIENAVIHVQRLYNTKLIHKFNVCMLHGNLRLASGIDHGRALLSTSKGMHRSVGYRLTRILSVWAND